MTNPQVDAGREHARLETVARLRLDGDWEGLIEWAKDHGCLPDRYGADDPNEYTWAGIHSTDARYVAPTRRRLLLSCLSEALEATPTPTGEEADDGHD